MPVIRYAPPVQAEFNGPRVAPAGDRVDSSGALRALDSVKQEIGNAPNIPTPNFSGFQQLGAGMQQGGEAVMETMKRNQALTDARIAADVQTGAMDRADQLKLKLQAEKDPNKWADLAAQDTADYVSSVNTEGMSEPAAHHLTENYLKRWQNDTITRATYNGVMQNEEETRKRLDAMSELGAMKKNPELVVSALNEKEHLGLYGSPEEKKLELEHKMAITNSIAETEVGTAFNDAIKANKIGEAEAIITDHPSVKFLHPEQVLHMNNVLDAAKQKQMAGDFLATNPKGFMSDVMTAQLGDGKFTSSQSEKFLKSKTPAELQEFQDMAFQRIQQDSNQALATAENDLADGTLKMPGQLSPNKDNPSSARYVGLSPSDKQHVEKIMARQAIEGKKLNPDIWMKYANVIPTITPGTPAAQLAAAQLGSFINIEFAGENQKVFRESLQSMLKDQMDGSPAASSNGAIKLITEGFKAGGFGVTEVPYSAGNQPWAISAPIDVIYSIYGDVVAGITGNTKDLKTYDQRRQERVVPATPLTPEQQYFVDHGGKLKEGTKVIDIQRQAEAQKQEHEAIVHLMEMRKAGASEKDQYDYAQSVLKTSALRGMVPAEAPKPSTEQRLNKATSVLQEIDNNPLFNFNAPSN